ncbi:MAG TPA: toll/interleukin-1 receptor domain-containing protein [Thermoanaerobaculia bacterium]|jgi:hypothetical protein
MSNIFLSYVREDIEVAERLYEDLKRLKGAPWMDKHDLIPGDGWRGAIKQAIRKSSHVLILLSTHSLRKRGVAQSEIREALALWSEVPPDKIFIIPIRLEDVSSPFDELNEIQWVDFFPSYEDGLGKLAASLRRTGGIPGKLRRQTGSANRDEERIAYRDLFRRPAFEVPAIFEYALWELDTAVDQLS